MKRNVMHSKFNDRLHYSWSPIDEEKPGKHGRFGVYYGRDLDREIGGSLHGEYHTWRPLYLMGAALEVNQNADEPIAVSLYLWPFSLYLHVDTPVMKWLTRKLAGRGWNSEREIALKVSSRYERGTMRWSVWHPVDSWSSGTPRWRNGHFNIVDVLLGHRDMRWEPVETVDVSIPMPERWYPATVEMRDHVSWRRRLPFLRHRHRCCNVEIPGGIGFPGKGENAWDCGDDAIFSLSGPAQTVEDAVGKVVSSVLRNRKRYGGSYTFTPKGGAA